MEFRNYFIYPPPHRIFLNKKIVRANISQKKLKSLKLFIKLIGFFPQIKLLGLSGSIAIMNAKESHDIDVFIITAENRLWIGRFLAILTAKILGLHRKRGEKRVKDKICLNLFFEESDMVIPANKRNLYTAHEVLQMKPLIVKDNVYERFLAVNKWVFKFFPNAVKKQDGKQAYLPVCLPTGRIVRQVGQDLSSAMDLRTRGVGKAFKMMFNIFEFILKNLQLYFINKHKTTETATKTQLWFFRRDFEKELKKRKII